MADEAAFLAAVAAHPADDTPRLVYADWLDDRGDPRAAWLRADVAARRAEVLSDEYWACKDRRQTAATGLDPSWLAAVAYLPSYRPLFTTLPDRRADRWRLADTFIEYWHGPFTRADGYSEAEIAAAEARLGVRLPAALREWHTLAGRGEVWSAQDRLLAPVDDRWRSSGRLVIRAEAQGCEAWLVRSQDLGADDPPVYQRDDRRRVATTVSAFALFVLLYEAKFSRRAVWSTIDPDPAGWRRLRRLSTPAAVAGRYWFNPRITFWEGDDFLIERWRGGTGDGQGYVSARTEAAFERVRDAIGGRLERHG